MTGEIHPLLSEFLEREKQYRPPNTYSNRRSGIRAFAEWADTNDVDITDVGPVDMEDFAGWLVDDTDGRGLTDGTAMKYVEQASKFYQYLAKKNETDPEDTPVAKADLKARIPDPDTSERTKVMKDGGYRAVSPEQYERLIEHLPTPKLRNQLAFQLMWDCGLRPSEVVDIELDDLDRQNREIRIRAEKTYANRVVFFGEKVATLLGLWLDGGERATNLYAESSDKLLLTRQSRSCTTGCIRKAFRKAATATGLDNTVYTDAGGHPRHEYGPYSLRHGFAERMVDKVDLETLRQVMGHEKLETTKRYLNPDKKTRRRKMHSALDD